jgi:hypothetical protein
MPRKFYLLCPALIAIVTSIGFAAPGCGSDSCQGARSKICEKACACGSDCSINGIKFGSKTSCSFSFGAQCDPTNHDVDWAACSLALDTAQCSGGDGSDGGTDSGIQGVLLIPEECSGTQGSGGTTGSGSSSSVTSSGSM